MSFAAAEADRRIANANGVGIVTAIDAARVRARVRIGALETPFIPVMQIQAGRVRFMSMPSVGEQVTVVAPDGDYARAYVGGAIFAGNAPGAEAGHVFLHLGGGELRITGDLVIEGDVRLTGTVTAETDVVAAGKSLVSHTHPHGDPAGTTGAPS